MPPEISKPARILVVEDTNSTALLILRLLGERGHVVRHVTDGAQALQRLAAEPFDLVVTDWRMPVLDGLELLRRIRERMPVPPPIVMQTALTDEASRETAALAGADEYLAKPWRHHDLTAAVERCLRRYRPASADAPPVRVTLPEVAPFHCVCIGASTGGPEAVRAVIGALPATDRAVFLLVVHGPAWMLEAYTKALARVAAMPVQLARHGAVLEPGHIHVAPGDRHTQVAAERRLLVVDSEPVHHMKPALDPLFRTASEVFARRTTAVVLTGLGQDGTIGASLVFAAGGRVLVQDPATCAAPSMPSSVIAAGVPCTVLPVQELAPAIALTVREHGAPVAVAR